MKNVILLTLDTLRKDIFGLYGNTEGLTPFLDSIKDKSIVFSNSYSGGPYTQASFPAILTSNYYLEYGREKNLNAKKVIISEALKKADVTTAGFHSNPYLSGFFNWNRGWDHYYDSMQDDVTDICPYIKGDVINQKVDTWLQSHKSGDDYNPFFLWAHYMDVHEPYVPAQKYIEKVDPGLNMSEEELMTFYKEVVLTRDASDSDKVALAHKLYKAHVIEIDEFCKGFFEIFEKNGVLEDSTIIITADHGDEFGDHGSLSHDGKFFNELVNVPLIIYNPLEGSGKMSDILCSGIDIPPTIAGLLNAEPDAGWKGQSMLPVGDYQTKGVYGECIGKLSHKVQETDKDAWYCRIDNFKVMYNETTDKWELYDLDADPGEKNNIIDSSDKAEEMKEKLNAFRNRNAENS